MRLLLLIMTGIGFTMGLLCGLLLHLPADGLPANADRSSPLDASLHDNDNSFRSRRSFGDDPTGAAALLAEESASASAAKQRLEKLQFAQSLGQNSPQGSFLESGSVNRPSFQSRPNPQIDSNPFVSVGGGANNNRGPQSRPATSGLSSGQGGLGRAEPSGGRTVKNEEEKKDEEDQERGKATKDNNKKKQEQQEKNAYYENAGPSLPAAAKPVKSFTLRLKNTGGKFVVDSAVTRQGDEDTQAAGAPKVAARDGKRKAGQTDTEIQAHDDTKVDSSLGKFNRTSALDDIVSGVVWSKNLDDSCPQGFEPKEVASWRRKALGMQVVGMEEGCGRMQNRLVTFKDGSQACARYRLNTDQIQGEVYSYYLARLLNITNLAPAVLLPVDTLSPQWRTVHLEMSMAQWADGRLVVLTRWLHDLAPSYIPQELREDNRKLHPTLGILGRKSLPELCDLLQWSDLIVFDYLTANLDRLVNNMFNRQWNAEMMSNPAHNLERTKGGSLIFLDNESGLFHGYRLLEKYHGYHESLLNSLCVFRESTAKAVKVLHKSKSVAEELHKLFREGEIHHRHLPSIPEKNASVLQDRLAKVYDQIVKCEALYAR